MAKKAVKKNVRREDDKKLFAFLAVFLSIIGFAIALIAKKQDKYVMFYAKQSLVLFIAGIIIWIASFFLLLIPVIGYLIYIVASALLVAGWVIGWIYALSGDEKEIPLIGQYAYKIKL